tara:strand:- start:471 stop:1403 length:933 start_codon:yes stop_codon:yes gene_type:complete
METKLEALERLQNDYTDKFGRICIYPPELQVPEEGRYPTQNYNLWTGEANLMMYMTQDVDINLYENQKNNFYKSLKAVEIVPGLITRNPDPYRESQWFDPVSLDEYNGLCFSMAVFEELRIEARHILKYGEDHDWAFVDDKPGLKGLEAVKKRPFKTILDILKLIFLLIRRKSIDEGGDIDKLLANSPELYGISRIRLPKDRLLIKACVPGAKISFLEKLHLFLATLTTSRLSNDETSGKILAFFRFKALRLLKCQPYLVKLAEKHFRKQMKKKYGESYMEKIFAEYNIFKDNPNHPFHTLIKGLSNAAV